MDEYLIPAIPLFNLLCNASNIQHVANVLFFQDKIIATIQECSQQINLTEKEQSIVRYWFAAAIDEAMLKQEWALQSQWFQQSLLIRLFNDSRGGVKFYELLDTLLHQTQTNQGLLFLAYLLLQAGFQGKYINTETEERSRLILSLQHRLQLNAEQRATPRLFVAAEAGATLVPAVKPNWRKAIWITVICLTALTVLGNILIYMTTQESVNHLLSLRHALNVDKALQGEGTHAEG